MNIFFWLSSFYFSSNQTNELETIAPAPDTVFAATVIVSSGNNKILNLSKSTSLFPADGTVKESINIPIKSMVNIANQTLRNYIENLSENDKKEFFQIISEDTKTLETKFETLRESTINKLNVILENEKEFEVKTKISETIDRIKNEKFDQLNFLKLKNLENSI